MTKLLERAGAGRGGAKWIDLESNAKLRVVVLMMVKLSKAQLVVLAQFSQFATVLPQNYGRPWLNW